MIDNFKYTDSIVKSILLGWYDSSCLKDRTYIKEKGVHWIIPTNLSKLDVQRGLNFLKEDYNILHYQILNDVYLKQRTKKEIIAEYKLTWWEYYRVVRTGIGVITEFLNGEWRKK